MSRAGFLGGGGGAPPGRSRGKGGGSNGESMPPGPKIQRGKAVSWVLGQLGDRVYCEWGLLNKTHCAGLELPGLVLACC